MTGGASPLRQQTASLVPSVRLTFRISRGGRTPPAHGRRDATMRPPPVACGSSAVSPYEYPLWLVVLPNTSSHVDHLSAADAADTAETADRADAAITAIAGDTIDRAQIPDTTDATA